MNIAPAPAPRLRIVAARLLQLTGWAGVLGLGLLLAAAWITYRAWLNQPAADRAVAELSRPRAALPSSVAAPSAVRVIRLPSQDDLPKLLARIDRAASSSGLQLAAAEYRIVPATESQPAVLEVKCAFKGPYPKLRATIVELLGTSPATTFRELSLSRASVDTEEVDAKLTIAMLLSGESKPLDRR